MSTFGMLSGTGWQEDWWIAEVPTWKAGVFPIGETPYGAGDGSLVLVMADGSIVHKALLSRAEAADVPALIADAVRKVARNAGAFPGRLIVTDPAVAARLAREMEPYQVHVRCRRSRELRRAVREREAYFRTQRMYGGLHPVEGLADVGLDAQTCAALFAAAARYWRARPWERWTAAEGLLVSCRGSDWVLATAPPGEGVGATAFSDPDDFEELGAPCDCLDTASGPVYGVRFVPADELPPVLLREVVDGGWEVEEEAAYPLLLARADWDGRLTAAAARRVTMLLNATAMIADANPRVACGDCFTLSGGEIKAVVVPEEVPPFNSPCGGPRFDPI